jgi:hypothetical protein
MQHQHKLKILKNSGHQLNTSIFVLLSMVFLHMIAAKFLGISGLSPKSLQFSYKNFLFLPPISVLTIYLIRKFKHSSTYVLLFYMVLIWSASFWVLYLTHLDKILLGLVFFEVLLSFYFFQLWNEELGLACHNPDFTIYDLEPDSFHTFEGHLDLKQKYYPFTLSNWDENSCFVKLQNPGPISGECTVTLKYDGQSFVQKGKIVSEYGGYQGVGIKFINDKKHQAFNWMNFYEILHERGILPVWSK